MAVSGVIRFFMWASVDTSALHRVFSVRQTANTRSVNLIRLWVALCFFSTT
jgi:hypothetical protein